MLEHHVETPRLKGGEIVISTDGQWKRRDACTVAEISFFFRQKITVANNSTQKDGERLYAVPTACWWDNRSSRRVWNNALHGYHRVRSFLADGSHGWLIIRRFWWSLPALTLASLLGCPLIRAYRAAAVDGSQEGCAQELEALMSVAKRVSYRVLCFGSVDKMKTTWWLDWYYIITNSR